MEHQPGKKSFAAISVVQGSPLLWVLRPSVALSPPLPPFIRTMEYMRFYVTIIILHAPPKPKTFNFIYFFS